MSPDRGPPCPASLCQILLPGRIRHHHRRRLLCNLHLVLVGDVQVDRLLCPSLLLERRGHRLVAAVP